MVLGINNKMLTRLGVERCLTILITTTTKFERKNEERLPMLLRANDDVKQIVGINDPSKKLNTIKTGN